MDLKAIRERCEKATPGPWMAQDYTGEPTGYAGINAPTSELFVITPGNFTVEDDMSFIAHARTDLPALVSWCERAAKRFRKRNLACCCGESVKPCRECVKTIELLAELE